ncbi:MULTISPECIES: helix-turn-helix transcriptional regulator [Staphylococcus]|uniref:Helix-turn-helix domain-containing protein n=1 Tax=Staphylococcus agnetis TaxID=985762 RepID=A0AAW9YUE3_9STAP|nr:MULTISPECIES: helix-turn-helix transcriptional regulator [Staphylococcus]NHM92097.1 helix-turn-helix transcriptional regulator [Staphylococcus sp. 10602379]NJI02816.1 helix-turn-helix domain-containing protein [Staphylococcus agnetis]NJI13437.1 helix-turn-helix domain-containing protein [Staphylococcus agnetis]QIN23655.1 helix-turn-helix domain-containing protein [Staphylococcus agnetis]
MKNLTYPLLFITRREKGDTQKAIARKLNISQQRYQLKESGKANFTLPEAQKLSEMYGIPIEQLFSTEFPVAQ